MCYGCYEEAGKPEIVNDGTKKAAALAGAVYEFNGVGGNCHIVLDDFNIEDDDIEYCLNQGLENNVHGHTAEQLEIEKECLLSFKVLSFAERASALALHEGWLKA